MEKNDKISSNRKSYGFTLIELIIVMAVIGILATAVLAAINPIEQLKKGRDTGKKADSAEFLNATERYYATFQCYPWDYDGTTCASSPAAVSNIQMDTMDDGAARGAVNYALKEMSTETNEIKAQFLTRGSLKKLYVTKDDVDLVHVCFEPESKTFRVLAKYQRDGSTTCTPGTFNGTATSCHICVPE